MEGLAEQIVAMYLTRGGKVFIVPQYAIAVPGKKSDWSCPDFVALDFSRKEVVIVEVTTASDVGSITNKAKDRETQWFRPLRDQLRADEVVTDWTPHGWTMRFLGFVRQASLQRARDLVSGHEGVSFEAIEAVTFAWDYWTKRVEGGLPR